MYIQAQMLDKLTIKNSVIRADDVFGFIASGILSYYVLRYSNLYWAIIPFIFSTYLIFNILKRLKDRKPKLVFDNIGIELSDQKTLYKWSEIKFAFIERNGGVHNSLETNDSLRIVLSNREVSIGLKKLSYSEKAIERQIEFYLGKDKSKPQDKFKSEIKKILIDKEKIDEVMVLFSKHKTHSLLPGLLIVFGLPGLSIYFQFNSDFPYVFAFGFVITVISMFAFVKIINKRFRNSHTICDLTEKEFNAIFKKYRFNNDRDKKREMLGYIFLTVLTVLIFTISYFVTK